MTEKIDSKKIVSFMDEFVEDVAKADLNPVETAALLGCIQSVLILSLSEVCISIEKKEGG